MLHDYAVAGSGVRKPTSDLLLHLLANPILRDESFPEAFGSPKQSPWSSPSSPMMETQSFTARRPATSSLPAFNLPPPTDHFSHPRYPSYAPASSSQPAPAIVSSVLTPPAGLASDLSPLASSVSGSSGSSSQGVPPYQPSMGFWPSPHQPSYAFSQAPSMPAPFAQGQHQHQQYPLMRPSPLYSPPLNYPGRSTHSPSAGEGPSPPYDLNLPPFPTPMSGGGHSQNQSLPTLAPQHQQQQQQQQQQQHHHHHHQQQHHQGQQNPQQEQSQHQQMSHHGLPAVSHLPSQQSPLHAPDTYGGRPPPTPTYYTPSSTPQQSSFPAYVHQSPTQQSPITSSTPSHRMSPVSAQNQSAMVAPQGYPQPYNRYPLPAMNGPIMSNVHNPGNQMALVGGMHMQGYPHHHQQMYGQHPHGQLPVTDRPFKCDQCQQSFNRNHDLKRHKKIHLAVKPYPCGHCEKSFTRKDALKRHILVKSCGKRPSNGGANANEGSSPPVDKNDVMSDSTEDNSPEMTKKELV
ncbi:hypothetical protein LZ554_001060 [Drepanopeziza brunnea f. sp. 'monogermtubi']|nr:hypothetical protein LZ554_001060 [Drepanopeziza brunnea f. sp. 'monogermtubi']